MERPVRLNVSSVLIQLLERLIKPGLYMDHPPLYEVESNVVSVGMPVYVRDDLDANRSHDLIALMCPGPEPGLLRPDYGEKPEDDGDSVTQRYGLEVGQRVAVVHRLDDWQVR
jgi:hypothetical protein